jgi:hypothetical protein
VFVCAGEGGCIHTCMPRKRSASPLTRLLHDALCWLASPPSFRCHVHVHHEPCLPSRSSDSHHAIFSVQFPYVHPLRLHSSYPPHVSSSPEALCTHYPCQLPASPHLSRCANIPVRMRLYARSCVDAHVRCIISEAAARSALARTHAPSHHAHTRALAPRTALAPSALT